MGTKTTRQAGSKGRSATGRRDAYPANLKPKNPAPPSKVGTNGERGTTAKGGADPAYLTLIRRLPLRPIRTDADLDVASRVLDELTDRDILSPAESDYLEVLGDLVEKYEDEHVETLHVSDGAMLRSLMDEKGVRQADVARGAGVSKTVLSLVLNGKRRLTRHHIGALSKYFGVNASSFLGPE